MNIKFYINGVSFHKYCTDNGISESKYKFYLWLIKNKCMTPEEALQWKHKPARADQKQRRRECSRRFLGYGDDELNMTTEEAKRRGNLKKAKYICNGKTIGELAKEYNMPRGALYHRIRTLGMYWKDAISYPSLKETVIKYNGISIFKLFDEKKAHAIANRIRRGWGIEQAVNTPIKSNWKNMSLEQRFGKDYKQITHWRYK